VEAELNTVKTVRAFDMRPDIDAVISRAGGVKRLLLVSTSADAWISGVRSGEDSHTCYPIPSKVDSWY
jgi:hypothetical protein